MDLALVWLYRELSVLGCPRTLRGSPSRIVTIRYLHNFIPDSVCLFHTLSSMGKKTTYKKMRPPTDSNSQPPPACPVRYVAENISQELLLFVRQFHGCTGSFTTSYLGSSMRSSLQRGQRPGLVNRFRLSNTYPHTRHREGITTRRWLCETTERAMWER